MREGEVKERESEGHRKGVAKERVGRRESEEWRKGEVKRERE